MIFSSLQKIFPRTDRPTDQPTNRPTKKWLIESRSTRLKIYRHSSINWLKIHLLTILGFLRFAVSIKRNSLLLIVFLLTNLGFLGNYVSRKGSHSCMNLHRYKRMCLPVCLFLSVRLSSKNEFCILDGKNPSNVDNTELFSQVFIHGHVIL